MRRGLRLNIHTHTGKLKQTQGTSTQLIKPKVHRDMKKKKDLIARVLKYYMNSVHSRPECIASRQGLKPSVSRYGLELRVLQSQLPLECWNSRPVQCWLQACEVLGKEPPRD